MACLAFASATIQVLQFFLTGCILCLCGKIATRCALAVCFLWCSSGLCLLSKANVTLQMVNLFNWILPNAFILARYPQCVWFANLIQVCGCLRWTCWNSVGLQPGSSPSHLSASLLQDVHALQMPASLRFKSVLPLQSWHAQAHLHAWSTAHAHHAVMLFCCPALNPCNRDLLAPNLRQIEALHTSTPFAW